ncbi:MAG: TonB-dependent receptor, partial [Gammaproteobacteria bacterium]|nr:TonB-dependent receptor [Gammaproteobacteria bacterium]NIY11792.1 TonB-dependent receptor [Gemmatimonadota bacterium]
PGYTAPNQLPNPDLRPEETTAWEVGTDLGFFNERLGFVVTYYDNSTVDQIMPVQISRATGYTSRVLNAGEVRNWGTELLLNATPVRMDNGLRWDVTLNWAKNNSEVVELYGDLETLVLGTYWSLNIEARKGEPYGAFYGIGYKYDENGNLLVDDDGYPIDDPEAKVLGNYN